MVDNLVIVNVKLRSYSSVMVSVMSNVHVEILLVSFYRKERYPLLLGKVSRLDISFSYDLLNLINFQYGEKKVTFNDSLLLVLS